MCTGLLGQVAAVTMVALASVDALEQPTVNAPDEPRPVPDGMSAMLTISMTVPMSWASSTSRMIGCSICSGRSTRSSAEYFRK